MKKMHCASCCMKLQMLRWCILIFAQGVQKRIVEKNLLYGVVYMAFLREPFNINHGFEWSTFIVVGEKQQFLISPRLALGGAIGA